MNIKVEDGRTKYEIDLEPTGHYEQSGLHVVVITDDQQVFKGMIPELKQK